LLCGFFPAPAAPPPNKLRGIRGRLECWASAFLAQNGLDPENWPEEFRKRVGKLPEDIQFL